MQSGFIKLMKRFIKVFLLTVGIWCIGGTFNWWFQPTVYQLSQGELRTSDPMPTNFNALKIIVNNLLVITICLTGIFTAGITTILTLLVNGFFAVMFLKDLNITGFPWEVKCRFSYIIFEICALWTSGVAGLLGFSRTFKLFIHSQFSFPYMELVSIIIAYFISMVLTVIAGFIEADLITLLTIQK